MPDRFRRSRPAVRDPHAPWLRIGRLEVGTSVLVCLLVVVSALVFVIEPGSKVVSRGLALSPSGVLGGRVWELLTWPLAVLSIDLWLVITVAVFWFAGTRLEEQIGRVRMLWFLLGITIPLGAVAVGLGAALGYGSALVLGGLSTVEMLVLLTFVAEHPQLPFFFGIRAWVVGLVLVGLQVFQSLAYRDIFGLLVFVVGLVVAAVAARWVGLLQDVTWLGFLRGRRGQRGRGTGSRRSGSRPTVVPFQSRGSAPVTDRAKDEQELDALLDKISAGGLDALSGRERKRLDALRERLRRG